MELASPKVARATPTDRVPQTWDLGREGGTGRADQRKLVDEAVCILWLGLPASVKYQCERYCVEPLEPLVASVLILQGVI